jgi:UDP-3-O-[3-hydroxymyristoyl] N-acetylglucosamine deacetylase/3-hydroxyacyl-[acyl-carrier-protein] dehydratase
MVVKQRTIKKPVSFTGTGLHTGVKSKITFAPEEEDTGIYFVRTDIDANIKVPALVDYVDDNNGIDSLRGTNLKNEDVKIYTVEHVLAAIAGLELDNIRIELTAQEPPVGDGSALPYVDALLEAGIVEQNAQRIYLEIEETIDFNNEQKGTQIVALPLDGFRITTMVDYQNPALGSQHTGLFSIEKEFITEFAPARTFCFLHEVEALYDQGLIKGGNLDNAVVIVDKKFEDSEIDKIKTMLSIEDDVFLGENGILNNRSLRFKNEPCRHKTLDLLGDMFLCGYHVKAQILAARPGHKSNIAFARLLRDYAKKAELKKRHQHNDKKGVIFDINAIKRILPHRYPFLLVDSIIELELGSHIVGTKAVSANEPFFEGHFPGHPIMPGVLIIEAMAQTGGILVLNEYEEPEKKIVYFMGIDDAKFRKPVFPGDLLHFELNLLSYRRGICKMQGTAFVRGEVVAEAMMTAVITDRDQLEKK